MRVREIHGVWKVYLNAHAKEHFWCTSGGKQGDALGLPCENSLLGVGHRNPGGRFGPGDEEELEKEEVEGGGEATIAVPSSPRDSAHLFYWRLFTTVSSFPPADKTLLYGLVPLFAAGRVPSPKNPVFQVAAAALGSGREEEEHKVL